jgi:DNA-binding MarR family transcriptional regulator
MAAGEAVIEQASPETARYSLALLDHLARVGRRAAEAASSAGGLRPRHLVVLTLLHQHGPTSQQGLAETLSLDPSNVVALLNELEDRGLMTRRRDPVDRRRHTVELTAQGQDELESAQRRLSCVEDELLRALTSEERATLYELLLRAAGDQLPRCVSVSDFDAEAESPC